MRFLGQLRDRKPDRLTPTVTLNGGTLTGAYMDEQREGMVVAALAGICLFVAVAHMLAYVIGRLGWV